MPRSARSVVTTAGRELEVDALLFGTGFRVLDMPIARIVRGRDGRTLADVWDGSPHAHLGTTVPGFPDLFMLLGPHTGLGHSSMVYMIESQIAYVLDAMGAGEVVEVRPEVERASNEEVRRRNATEYLVTSLAQRGPFSSTEHAERLRN
jgi:cation diffusion facilitator CzcD-associated flavoprotein CzcO